MSWEECLPEDLRDLYEIHDFKHAATILSKDFPIEFEEVCSALKQFRFSDKDILVSGENVK